MELICDGRAGARRWIAYPPGQTMNKFFNRYSFAVIMVVVFCLPIMTRGARKALTSNDNNVHDWLPAEYQETRDFDWFQKRFENETFILISWEGATLTDPHLELLAQKLVPPKSAQIAKPLFKKVETGPRLLERLTTPPLNLSEKEALSRLAGLFVGPYKPGQDPSTIQSCAVITLTEEGKRDLRYTVGELRKLTTKELGLTRDRVRMGGPPVDNVAISDEAEKTLIRLFIPAGVVGLSLAYWCLRSVRLMTMVFATALYGGAMCLSMVWYSGGTMNAILQTMPAVIYVAGISGAIHFANYYRDSVVESGVEGAPARALSRAWLPCTLSAVTTAAGLASLYTSELVPIKLFGIYTAMGVLATLALLFVFLPAWMQVWPMKPHSRLDGDIPKAEDLALPQRWRKILGGVLDHHRLVLVGLMLLMVVAGIGLSKVQTSVKLTKLFAPEAEIIHHYAWLEENLGPLVPMEVIIRMDKRADMTFLDRMELIDRVQTELEKIPHVGNTMSAVTFAPSLKIQRKGFLTAQMQRPVYSKRLQEHEKEYIANGFLAHEGDEQLWRVSARVDALSDVDYGEFIGEIRDRVEPVLAAQKIRLAKLAEKKHAAALAAAEAQEAADEEATDEEADDAGAGAPVLAAATAHAGKNSTAAAPDAQHALRATYTGLVPLVYKAQRSMLNGLVVNFITDLLTIAAVLTVVFVDLSAGLIMLLPSAFPAVVVFGLLGWMGVLVDVGTVMTPTVALGVSVDDVVHFLIWYRRGLKEGKSRRDATMLAYEGCARAMYQSWSVLGLGLAVFALSSFMPTQRFGMMMFCLLTASLIGNLLLLPAVLCSPLAWFFGRGIIRKAQQHKDGLPLEEDFPEDLPPPQPLSHIHVRRDGSHRAVHSEKGVR